MLKYKKKSLAGALGIVTGLCACCALLAPAGMTAYADGPAIEEDDVVTEVEEQAVALTPDGENSAGSDYGVMPLSGQSDSGWIMLKDYSGHDTGYRLFAAISAEEGCAYMKMHVVYDETLRNPEYQYIYTDRIYVEAYIWFHWGVKTGERVFLNRAQFNALAITSEAAGGVTSYYYINGNEYSKYFMQKTSFDGNYDFEAYDYCDNYNTTNELDKDCTHITFQVNAFMTHADNSDDYGGCLCLSVIF